VGATVTRQEPQLNPVELAEQYLVRRRAPWAIDLTPFAPFKTRDLIKPRPADDA
jgi:hypothetical protein